MYDVNENGQHIQEIQDQEITIRKHTGNGKEKQSENNNNKENAGARNRTVVSVIR